MTLTSQKAKVHPCDLRRPRHGASSRSTVVGVKTAGQVDKPTKRRNLEREEIDTFSHVASGVLGRVRLVRTNLLPPAADGMTVGRFVFLRGDRIHDRSSTLLAHELVHVRQFAELGAVKFFMVYLGSYFSNLVRLRNHRQAYLAIPLEVEARREADEWKKRRAQDADAVDDGSDDGH